MEFYPFSSSSRRSTEVPKIIIEAKNQEKEAIEVVSRHTNPNKPIRPISVQKISPLKDAKTLVESPIPISSSSPVGSTSPIRCDRRFAKRSEDNFTTRRFDTLAGNPIKEILLKLNLPDHRLILTDSKVTPTKHRYLVPSNSQRRSVKVKELKKDAPLKLFKFTNQERYEHVSPKVTSSQVHKMAKFTRWQKEIMLG
ncbi:hypothetical protein Tco_0815715 [Tanacetum coccineum]